MLIVVSFHSLEDKIVKNFFNLYSNLQKNPSRYFPSRERKSSLGLLENQLQHLHKLGTKKDKSIQDDIGNILHRLQKEEKQLNELTNRFSKTHSTMLNHINEVKLLKKIFEIFF